MKPTRRFILVGLALAALGVASCNKAEGRKPTFSVTGKVLLPDGKPAEHATVVFHPTNETSPDVPRPRGKVAADGSFKLTTYDGDDGAPTGDYRVTVELWLSSGRGDEGPSNRLPEKYARPEKSSGHGERRGHRDKADPVETVTLSLARGVAPGSNPQ